MAEDTLTGRAEESRDAFSPARLISIAQDHRVALITIAVGLITLCLYRLIWYLPGLEGPQPTIYNNFVRLADSFLHGRIDIANGLEIEAFIEVAHNNGKQYIIPPPWPAFVVLPGVIVWGLALNQTLVSTVIGAINSSTVYNVTRGVTRKLSTQLWLTVLVAFGTVYFYAAITGAVWFFSHTVAVLFLFFAIYFTLVRKNPLMAGLCLGAAFWSRQPTILTLPFFLIMFSDDWLIWDRERPLLQRINWQPLLLLGSGLGVFVILSFIYNYMRFGTPADASQHHLPDHVLDQPWFQGGKVLCETRCPFDPAYISRHVVVFFEGTPVVRSQEPYLLSNLGGSAIWTTTPAFFYALFAGWKDRRYVIGGILLLALAVGIVVSRAVSGLWDSDWHTYTFERHINILPFYVVMGMALWFGRKDKFIMACWAAIIPTALMLFTFAGTGFSQYGYRFQLDFMPFLFLLTAYAMGPDLKWHHKLFIVLSVIFTSWGILWEFQFEPDHAFGIDQWRSF
jgi:hypothetical protein